MGEGTRLAAVANPIDQAILHVVGGIDGPAAGDELEHHDAEGEDVRFVRELAAGGVLRGQVPARVHEQQKIR